ncbi:S-adenosyl-l-methionine hydroxide adenosyltransferase family protein [Methanonatronarchaeum sp. AMET-Sl]|uniref:SAM hydrolase/SAM-dependent halogenase family protein n=1 Tax=Methanonatronarchaeum sp. AMET-Sl TaxID=3037654 RepID=UPI00244DE5CD|nr:S-adenosyl-l-methionine hydroxide adenosyltransferase family protein [Methanonatronarchaeum sp. AMET-Sl]WGI17844.1 S-adenosyl-l-methionine hydroxide adenosyltransferase family protein [Methanonatronarchaeum sp. AMET-Sl]
MLTFLSDFGSVDGYPGVMKAVASGITGCRLVDITHTIPRQDIVKGAYVYRTAVNYFPSGTVHVGVVDPGVGTDREGIVVKAGGQYFVGPDNGLFIPAARFLGEFEVYVIENENYTLESVSNTFHGRDVFSPVGAWLTTGVDLCDIGSETNDFVDLGFGDWSQVDNVLRGCVINIDGFGNVITNIPSKEVDGLGFGDTVIIDGFEMPYKRCYGEVDIGSVLLTTGSHGFLEVSVNQGSARKNLDVERGDELEIKL